MSDNFTPEDSSAEDGKNEEETRENAQTDNEETNNAVSPDSNYPTLGIPVTGSGANPYGSPPPAGNPYTQYAPPTGSPYSTVHTMPGALPPPGKKPGTGAVKAVALSAITALLVGGVGGYAGYSFAQKTEETSPAVTIGKTQVNSNSSAADASPRANNSIAKIAENVSPSVVSIGVESANGSGTGSGFIVRDDGYIVTNNHVVAGAGRNGTITVTLSDGTEKTATVVGTNAPYDLAVLKIDSNELPVVTLGDSSQLRVGDGTVAIGSPLGLSGTVTSGIVSALNRPVTAGEGNSGPGQPDMSYISAIQTDAAINPGNSGGPLVNSRSEVIGVNSAIATLGGGNSGGGAESGSIGLGFAIPINTAKRVAEEIISTGKSSTTTLGIQLDTAKAEENATVAEVTAGSAADKAGLKKGDVIVAIDKKPVADSLSLITLVRSYSPGDTVTLTVTTSDGKTKDVTATLGSNN